MLRVLVKPLYIFKKFHRIDEHESWIKTNTRWQKKEGLNTPENKSACCSHMFKSATKKEAFLSFSTSEFNCYLSYDRHYDLANAAIF